MIEVYHATKPTFGLPLHAPDEGPWPKGYELVAKVDTHDLDEAFGLTQHIEDEWWKNKKVELVKKSRSTSVGDVLKQEGRLYTVEFLGFSEKEIADGEKTSDG
jgi:hypothetical protein